MPPLRSAPRARGRAVRIPARGTEKAMHSLSIPQRTHSRQPVSVVRRHGHHARSRRLQIPRAQGENHPAPVQ
jgi:hypothetical protein